MKLKILLFAVFAAGIGASYALAGDGNHKNKNGCQGVHLRGTIAAQTLTVSVDKVGDNSPVAAGSQIALALGATGQVVRVNIEACSTGTGAALQYSVRSLELRVVKPETVSTTATATTDTTGKHHGDDGEHGNNGNHGDHHKGDTTTAATTTAATTTAHTTTATTTTAPTTTAATTTSH